MVEFCNNVKVLAGHNAISKIAYEMKFYNSSRALILYDEDCGKKYLSAFLKAIQSSDINYEVLMVSNDCMISDVNNAVTYFYECGMNSIIGLGGRSVADIAKATRYTVSHNYKAFTMEEKFTKGADNIPLILVACDLAGKTFGSKRIFLIDNDKSWALISSHYVAADVVVIDPRMSSFVREIGMIENGAYAVLMALCADIENISSYARGYALAAIDLVRDNCYFNEGYRNQERRLAVASANVYAGIAYDECKDSLLPMLALHVSHFAKIRYKQAFNAIAPHYLDMFTNKSNKSNSEWLVAFLGVDKALKIDKEKRSQDLINRIITMLNSYRGSLNFKFTLSDFGIGADDLSKIYKQAVENGDIAHDLDKERVVLELLNRAL